MNQYEITFITKEDQNPNVEKQIISAGGKILSINSLGRKKFAYKISRETAGFYTSIVFQIEGNKLAELDKKISLDQSIMRHLTVKNELPKVLPIKATKTVIEEVTRLDEKKDGIHTVTSDKVITDVEQKLIHNEVSDKKNKKEAKKEENEIEKLKSQEPEKTEEKVSEPKEEKPKISSKPEKEAVSEEERLAKLEEKLDELLKD